MSTTWYKLLQYNKKKIWGNVWESKKLKNC
jgi:hypothetical protein